ncbi:hypothetical protein [Lapidilactobacillus luobeiensis]|uniref:hypothetical protein n=1 Tax=Lapidilactobacillus luobeiensis TaxID=2950371 RepID=UPI0021C4C4C9|nr:hypothetical protein [Lapidilactobacillus luobeiensis]
MALKSRRVLAVVAVFMLLITVIFSYSPLSETWNEWINVVWMLILGIFFIVSGFQDRYRFKQRGQGHQLTGEQLVFYLGLITILYSVVKVGEMITL